MPLVKQTDPGVGSRRNLNILCDVFLLGPVLIGILLAAAPGCCAKVETQIRLLDDDYTMPIRAGAADEAAAASPSHELYKNDLERISYETIHRILRDENEPMIYRANDLRFFHKRSSSGATTHALAKRSAPPAGIRLNFADRGLQSLSRKELLVGAHSLDDVTAINLHNNSLRELPPLGALPNLVEIDLSANNFTRFEVPPESAQLRVVNLNRNRIANFSARANNLHDLHLKDNEIRSLTQLNLSRLNELEILDLSCNQLENLETAFFPTRMKNLKYLNLARNRLQCIYRETFYNLLSVNTLTLSYNEITEIDYETFLALPNLQFLDLSYNQLRGDSIRALQGIPDLVGLSIAYNDELGDSMQEFVASWSLKELDASGTGLCKIPAALAQSVRTLKLADNWLTVISCGDLDSYPLLQYLDLSHSRIDEIEEDALGRLEILETLFLDHNNLKRIPISLPTSLENLFLHDNQILDIQPQAFQGLNNLKTLDLSNNKLLYLPELPLPKLLTLNLQSSGISGLHQAIVKTSPHLRDLYLEDNPIKCADLLGIAEWASPCRNDRRITERINIKSHYVRVHNYFERFKCGGNAAGGCATCAGDDALSPPLPSNGTRPSCVDVNRPGRVTKLTTELLMLTQERKNNEDPKTTTTTSPMAPKSPLTRKTYADSTTTTETMEMEMRTTDAPQTTAATRPEVSIPTTTITTTTTTMTTTTEAGASRMRTNSTDKISQKQLADGRSPPTLPPVQIKSDNNYVETSASSTTTHPSLLSQENTGKSQKGLKAQSDNATKIGRSPNGGTSEAPATAKSNLPTTTTTTSTIPPPPGSGQQQEQHQDEHQHHHLQHNRIQEILHTKDRHLIGTPLLMHKGHVALVPPAADVPRTTTTMPATMTSKENLLQHLAQRQDEGRVKGRDTTITTSKGHKLEMLAPHPQSNIHPYQQQQQQGSSENAVVKGPLRSRKTANGPLGQENHYQDIQQTIHKLLPDKDTTSAQQKSKETKPTTRAKDKNQRQDNGDGHFVAQQHRTLNTPLDGAIPRRDEVVGELTTPPTTSPPSHHSRVNTPLLRNDDTHGHTVSNGTTAALIKLETGPGNHSRQQTAVQPERWLDIRRATRHPGLVVVIGVTFAMVFVLGLVQVYRHRQQPPNYISHRHYGYPDEHQYQDHHQDHHQDLHQCQHQHHHQHSPHLPHTTDNHNSSYASTSPHHLLRIHEKPPTTSSSPMNCEFQREKLSSGYATSSSTNTTSNYRLFQLNGRRIKHNHHQPPADDDADFYTGMSHGPQSVLPSDFFPMELLSAPSTLRQSPPPTPSIVVPSTSSSSSSSAACSPPPPLMLPPTPRRTSTSSTSTSSLPAIVSLVGRQDIAVGRERSKFEIW